MRNKKAIMKDLDQYRILRKALEIISVKSVEEINEMLDAISKGSVEDIIIDEVIGSYNVTFAELQRKSRKREYAEPRQVAMYLLAKYTTMTLKAIGDMFGGRDHSTVIHAQRAVERDLYSTVYRDKVLNIENKIKFLINNKKEQCDT
jgi:chromosomal replication initiator protein